MTRGSVIYTPHFDTRTESLGLHVLEVRSVLYLVLAVWMIPPSCSAAMTCTRMMWLHSMRLNSPVGILTFPNRHLMRISTSDRPTRRHVCYTKAITYVLVQMLISDCIAYTGKTSTASKRKVCISQTALLPEKCVIVVLYATTMLSGPDLLKKLLSARLLPEAPAFGNMQVPANAGYCNRVLLIALALDDVSLYSAYLMPHPLWVCLFTQVVSCIQLMFKKPIVSLYYDAISYAN